MVVGVWHYKKLQVARVFGYLVIVGGWSNSRVVFELFESKRSDCIDLGRWNIHFGAKIGSVPIVEGVLHSIVYLEGCINLLSSTMVYGKQSRVAHSLGMRSGWDGTEPGLNRL